MVIALLCLCAFYFTYFFITKSTQNYNVNRKKRHGEEICKRLDFLVLSDKDYKS